MRLRASSSEICGASLVLPACCSRRRALSRRVLSTRAAREFVSIKACATPTERDASLCYATGRRHRQAVDEGWRGSWWIFLELDPALDPLRDDPEFQSIVETIRADMAAQRQQLDQMRANGELPPIP